MYSVYNIINTLLWQKTDVNIAHYGSVHTKTREPDLLGDQALADLPKKFGCADSMLQCVKID